MARFKGGERDVLTDVSVVVESYNHGEGSSLQRLALALRAATDAIDDHGEGEVLVADSSRDPALSELLEREFPRVRIVVADGCAYDDSKMKAAAEARGQFVLYLDGDCIPAPGWLESHLQVLRDGALATTGLTRYDGGFLGAVQTVMDFGFLLPAGRRPVPCYAFNNSAFRREVFQETPIPQGPMRCGCYAHAQLLQQAGTPVQMVPEARVRHERPPFFKERFRQGFDLVAACWTNPKLREGALLRAGPFAAPVFYARAVVKDLRRLTLGRRDIGLRAWQVPFAALLLPCFRLVDLAGIVRALAPGGREVFAERGAG